jgi:hypothetical protein
MQTLFWSTTASGLRLGRLWLVREASRLNLRLGWGIVLTVWAYGVLTGSLAMIISIVRGTTSATPVFLSGSIGMTAGTLFLTAILTAGRTIEERFRDERHVFESRSSEYRAARAKRAERRRDAKKQAALAATARVVWEEPEIEEEDSVALEVPRRRLVDQTRGTCWYCGQAHRQATQCPYCRMVMVRA